MESSDPRDRLTGLFSREYRKLNNYVRRYFDAAAAMDSEDIVQDVMLGLFEKADMTRPVRNLTAYVYRSLYNRAVDVLRRKSEPVSLDAPLPGDERSLADLLTDSRTGHDDRLEREERYQSMETAIGRLDDDEKAVIIENELNGISFRDLAREWEVPVGTLLARKSRALKKIRRYMSEGNESREETK